jgi:hypothetical protein
LSGFSRLKVIWQKQARLFFNSRLRDKNMSNLEQFQNLIEDYAVKAQIGAPSIEDNQCFLPAQSRSVHVLLAPQRAEVVVSSVVYLTDGDESSILSELIVAYNAWRLRNGGHRLAVDPVTKSLYLTLAKALPPLLRSGLAPLFDDFLEACRVCTVWYGAELHKRMTN